MRETFHLTGKPFSVNAMFYKDGRTKTQDWREWSARVFHQLSTESNLKKLSNLRNAFDASLHHVHVSLTVYYPREDFYNRNGEVSAKTMDVTNFEKPLVDLFCDKRYFETPYPYGCQNLNINDKYITQLLSRKVSGTEQRFEISFELVPAFSPV